MAPKDPTFVDFGKTYVRDLTGITPATRHRYDRQVALVAEQLREVEREVVTVGNLQDVHVRRWVNAREAAGAPLETVWLPAPLGATNPGQRQGPCPVIMNARTRGHSPSWSGCKPAVVPGGRAGGLDLHSPAEATTTQRQRPRGRSLSKRDRPDLRRPAS